MSFDSPDDNRHFAETEGFPFRLLSDSERTLAVAAGAASSTTAPVPSRVSYVVGPDEKVEHTSTIASTCTRTPSGCSPTAAPARRTSAGVPP